MNLASSTLKKQQQRYTSVLIQGLALSLIGGYVGVMLLQEGLGTSSGGKSAKILSFITKIVGDKADPEKVLAYILAAAMGGAVCFGIYYLILGILHVLPSKTLLGKSLLTQVKSYEKLSDVLSAADTDMNQGVQTFDKVFIGREWILEEMAMRISNIRGVFWMDEGESDYIMCCLDEGHNIWAASFTYKDDRDHAIQAIRTRLPEITYGDKEALITFRKNN